MTKQPKTTINIDPADAGPLYALAAALGHRRAGGGNLTGLLKYLMRQIERHGLDVVAEALAQENLAALAEALGQEQEAGQ